MPLPNDLPCPVCAALVADDRAHIEQHVTWHEDTKTLGPKRGSYATADGVRAGFAEMRATVDLIRGDRDDPPTAKLPPITDTVRRRPPVPRTLDPGTPAMLRALAAAMEDDGLTVDQLDDDGAPGYCPSLYDRGDGVEYQCALAPGHAGLHRAVNDWVRW